MSDEILKKLGPLAALAGVWEGEAGKDVAPDDDRRTEHNDFRERMVFDPFGPVENHEQVLYGLRYSTTAWRLGEDDPFHEELGYWMWDAANKQVPRCFIVPRGVNVIAGGTVEPDATSFELSAEVGSETYGICSNKFLDEEFKTVRYELTVSCEGDRLTYSEDTQMKVKGQPEIFHHTDGNTLKRAN